MNGAPSCVALRPGLPCLGSCGGKIVGSGNMVLLAVRCRKGSVRRSAVVEKRPIDKLTIKGFKTLKDVEIELGKLNVLIGPNGGGKSNFVSYFHMLREMIDGRLQVWVAKRGGADRVLCYGVKETTNLESVIEFGRNSYRFVLIPNFTGGFTFSREDVGFDGDFAGNMYIQMGSGEADSHLKHSNEMIAKYCYASISSWRTFHFHDTGDTALVKRKGELQDNHHLRTDASNLAAYLFALNRRSPATYTQIRDFVRLAIPFFDDFLLEPEEIRPDEYLIQLTWRQIDSDYPLLPSQLSDGSLRFICLVTALLQPDPPSTIIIDEPELGLHPYTIHLLGALFRSASKRMQVIVATQSTLLLDEFSIDDLIVVELQDGVSVFKSLEEEKFTDWLKDFSVGELWDKNVLGGGLP